MGSRIEVTGTFAVKYSDTITVNTTNTFVEVIENINCDMNFVPIPSKFNLSVLPQTLENLSGDLLLITFTGIVNITPIDPIYLQRLHMKCFAESNISWFWKSGLTQPDNRIDGVSTVLSNQYQSYLDDERNFDVSVEVTLNLTTSPQPEVHRTPHGRSY